MSTKLSRRVFLRTAAATGAGLVAGASMGGDLSFVRSLSLGGASVSFEDAVNDNTPDFKIRKQYVAEMGEKFLPQSAKGAIYDHDASTAANNQMELWLEHGGGEESPLTSWQGAEWAYEHFRGDSRFPDSEDIGNYYKFMIEIDQHLRTDEGFNEFLPVYLENMARYISEGAVAMVGATQDTFGKELNSNVYIFGNQFAGVKQRLVSEDIVMPPSELDFISSLIHEGVHTDDYKDGMVLENEAGEAIDLDEKNWKHIDGSVREVLAQSRAIQRQIDFLSRFEGPRDEVFAGYNPDYLNHLYVASHFASRARVINADKLDSTSKGVLDHVRESTSHISGLVRQVEEDQRNYRFNRR